MGPYWQYAVAVIAAAVTVQVSYARVPDTGPQLGWICGGSRCVTSSLYARVACDGDEARMTQQLGLNTSPQVTNQGESA